MALESLTTWTIPPDWADGLIERLEWQTTILRSPLNIEQRFATRLSPRQSFDISFAVYGPTRTFLDLMLLRAGGSPLYLPLWHDMERLTDAASIGDTTIGLDTTYTEFRTAKALMLFRGPFDYELAEISTVSDSAVSIVTTPLTKTWPAGTKVYPVKKCRVLDAPAASKKSGKVQTVTVRFQSLEPTLNVDSVTLNIYSDQYVLQDAPNGVDDLSYTYDREMVVLDNTTGLQDLYDITSSQTQQFSWYAKGKAAWSRLRALFFLLRGRCTPIWVPTFFMDLEPTIDIESGDTTIEVKRCGYTDLNGPWSNRKYIQIALRDGITVYRAVGASAIVGSGATERLTVDVEFIDAIPLSNIRRVSFLTLHRQDQDAIEMKHHTATKGLTTATSVFRSRLLDPVALSITDTWITPPTDSGTDIFTLIEYSQLTTTDVSVVSVDPAEEGGYVGKYAIGDPIPLVDYQDKMFFEPLPTDEWAAENGQGHYTFDTSLVLVPFKPEYYEPAHDLPFGTPAWDDLVAANIASFSGPAPHPLVYSEENVSAGGLITDTSFFEQELENMNEVILLLNENYNPSWSDLYDYVTNESRDGEGHLFGYTTAVTHVAEYVTKESFNLISNMGLTNEVVVKFTPGFAPQQNVYTTGLVVHLRCYKGGTFSVGADRKITNDGGILLWENTTTTDISSGTESELVRFREDGVV